MSFEELMLNELLEAIERIKDDFFALLAEKDPDAVPTYERLYEIAFDERKPVSERGSAAFEIIFAYAALAGEEL